MPSPGVGQTITLYLQDALLPQDDKHYVWAQTCWNYAHQLAEFYPSKPTSTDRENMKQLIYWYAQTLPCEKECRPHLLRLIQQSPPNLESRTTLRKWWIMVHNRVNRRLGKAKLGSASARKRIQETALLNVGYLSEAIFAQVEASAKARANRRGPPTEWKATWDALHPPPSISERKPKMTKVMAITPWEADDAWWGWLWQSMASSMVCGFPCAET